MIYWQPDEATKGINKMRYTKRSVEKHGGIVPHDRKLNILINTESQKYYTCRIKLTQ